MEIKSKFEFFRRNNLIYLDNAATTQVPDSVVTSVGQVLSYRGNPSRSAHMVASRSEELLIEARETIARFIGVGKNEIVFTNNATDSINLAVDAIAEHIKSGDEIILGISEHHSNMLPYLKLTKRGAKIRIVGLKDGVISPQDIKAILNDKTKIVAISHCSNVLGNINDVQTIGELVKEKNKNIFYFIDGTQAVAHLPVNLKPLKVDFYAFSSHKMYGPDGVGVLYISEFIHHFLSPVRAGGGTVKNVTLTLQKDGDIISPEYFQSLILLEGGTPNTSNIIGLAKAVRFIRSIGFDQIRAHEHALLLKLWTELKKFEEITLFGPTDFKNKIGLLSFGLKEYSTKELGDDLGRQKICIRYGSHCAFPLAEQMGQESIRVSIGVYNTEEDIDQLINAIKFFLDKKKGLIKNPNLELLKSKVYYRNTHIINSFETIYKKIKQGLYGTQETEIIIMGGHFLAIPDLKENRFWPSIKDMVPENLHGLLEEFGMTSFPLFTWELACKLVSELKSEGYNTKLSIIANDTTGINELRHSKANVDGKTAEIYKDEFLRSFSEDDIPNKYLEILKQYKLGKKDIVKNASSFYFRETVLRANFKKFIHNNKRFFTGIIDYSSAGDEENIDLSINILDNQQIKTCNFETFQSKTGGKFCIVELCQFIGELFGKAEGVNFSYLSEKVNKPKVDSRHKVLIALTPAMCDSAVTRAAELYTKLFLQEKGKGSFKFFNIPFGPNAERSMAIGTQMTYISDKDSLEVLDVENEPTFPELWKLAEYKLLYDSKEYFADMEHLFDKIGINKQSKMLDTAVGPGFFSTELLREGYDLSTADKNPNMILPFQQSLKEIGINHKTTISSWLELPKYYKNESFDLLLNRGNTFIYAAGGWNEMSFINKNETLDIMRKTLKTYYDLLKPGGYLYLDKFRDSEIPDKKVVARLNIENKKEREDIIFYVERKPEQSVRFAQMLLRDKDGKEKGLPNVAYDLSENEMESLLREVGFKFSRVPLKSERHFVVWLAQK
ncbi:MAG: aminotransferase class V-fold PLP-dependent enzyme [Candidatus Pacebacteria bacterium]|nr:aminotransferase class V-fold PLP-dependent enzyme [Candidatus Paceibacterota bacterium]